MYGKAPAIRFLINFHGKGGKGQQIDAVPVLQSTQISIAGRDPDHIGDTCHMAAGGSHPRHVMVPPLHVHRVIGAQGVHDDMGPRPSVINITHNMEMVYDQTLDQTTQSNDKLRGAADSDDGMDDFIVVRFLVVDLFLLRDQFLDHIGEILRQSLTYLGTGIFGRHPLNHLNQPVQRNGIPVLQVILFLFHDLQLFLRIVNQRGQTSLISAADGIPKFLVYLLADIAGAVFQHMVKLLVFSMNIRKKMLRPLGQIHDRLKINDLCGGRCTVSVLSGQYPQHLVILLVHIMPFPVPGTFPRLTQQPYPYSLEPLSLNTIRFPPPEPIRKYLSA